MLRGGFCTISVPPVLLSQHAKRTALGPLRKTAPQPGQARLDGQASRAYPNRRDLSPASAEGIRVSGRIVENL